MGAGNQSLEVRGRSQHSVLSLCSPPCNWQDFDYLPGEPNHLPVGVKAVVVADGTAPSNGVQAVPEAVGVLILVGLSQAFGGDVEVVVGGP